MKMFVAISLLLVSAPLAFAADPGDGASAPRVVGTWERAFVVMMQREGFRPSAQKTCQHTLASVITRCRNNPSHRPADNTYRPR